MIISRDIRILLRKIHRENGHWIEPVATMADFGENQHDLKIVVRGYALAVEPPAMGDALLTISLIAAKTRNQTLEVADPVSPQLLESLEQIQPIMHLWYPYLSMLVAFVADDHVLKTGRVFAFAPRALADRFVDD